LPPVGEARKLGQAAEGPDITWPRGTMLLKRRNRSDPWCPRERITISRRLIRSTSLIPSSIKSGTLENPASRILADSLIRPSSKFDLTDRICLILSATSINRAFSRALSTLK